jgi:glutathione S-transferase
MRLYQMQDSGNCYKVRLLAHRLALPLGLVDVDILKGESRTADFLARNPNGRVPTLELDDGRFLPESNAILFYLAEDTPFLPEDRLARAQALQWMFFEQYSHEPYVATPRYILRHLGRQHPRMAEMPERLAKGRAALAVMEQHLAANDFFAGGSYSIADIALYAYTPRAGEADLDLSPYPNLRAWLARVAAQPGHVEML